MSVERLYEELLKHYARQTLFGNPRTKLESDIAKLEARGLSREEAIMRLFDERIGDHRMLDVPHPRSEVSSSQQLQDTYRVYEGEVFGILYTNMDPFYDRLPMLGRILDYVERQLGEIVAIVPDIGFVSASFLLGTSFQGVKGVAIIYRRRLGQEQDQKAR